MAVGFVGVLVFARRGWPGIALAVGIMPVVVARPHSESSLFSAQPRGRMRGLAVGRNLEVGPG